jgi:hypothetical protein
MLFKNIIANISIKTDGELGLTDNNYKIIFLRLYSLGYNKFTINLISKNYDYRSDEIKINEVMN